MIKGYIISWFNSGRNYGQTLQAYALQKKLKNMGYDVSHVCFGTNVYPGFSAKKVIVQRIRLTKEQRNTQRKFDKFITEHMKVTNYLDSHEAICRFMDKKNPDFLICGSDQVWNPFNADPIYYLYKIGSERTKKIAYAVSTCDEKRMGKFLEYPVISKWIKGLDTIFVRENSGKRIFEQLYGVSTQVVLDPTLLLSGKEWIDNLGLSHKKERYILCYAFEITETQQKIIQDKAKKTNCKVHYGNILIKKDAKQTFASWSPEDFLEQILNAQEVYTDSFHGMVFSILFHKNFVVFDNGESLKSDPYYNIDRMKTLLEVVDLSDRIWNGNNVSSEIDYRKVDVILKEKREICISLLRKCIEQK